MNEKSPITPKSKVLQVIEEYPELEDVLIGFVPAFKKLKNPVLRKTVARVASLQQAATIANMKVEELVNHLRRQVGQDLYAQAEEKGYNTSRPEWFDEKKIMMELDASEMLERGEHPVNQVIADLKGLEPKAIYKLIAPFLPAPLIDKASSLQVEHWVIKEGEEKFVIYFCKT
ncbi:MAG: DUF1858 domain-containing protein [Bacteroidota bacterium]